MAIEPSCSFLLLASRPSPSSLFLPFSPSSFCFPLLAFSAFRVVVLLGAGLARASCESWAVRPCCVLPEPQEFG